MNFIDLFCGIGGFHQALSNLGFKCVFASDIDKKCRESYELNYGIAPAGDINDVDLDDIPGFQILCAGFPCQSFSKAGFRRGFDDNRGELFFRICDIARRHMPEYMILENVRNLASHDSGNTWRVIRESLTEIGYETYDPPLILNTLDFGIPQNRERVVILCRRKDLGSLPERPTIPKNKPHSLLKDFLGLGGRKIIGKLKVVEEVWDEFVNILIDNSIRVPKFPIWTDWWDGDVEGTASDTREKK